MNRRRKLLLFGGERSFLIPERFVLLVDSEKPGDSNDNQFEIRLAAVTTGTTFPVRFSPKDDPFDFTDVTLDVSDPTITFPSAGKYFVQIGKPFSKVEFNDRGDVAKVLENGIVQWGDLTWSSLINAFRGCNLVNLPDGPMTGNFTAVTNLQRCFRATNLNSIPKGLFNEISNVVDFEECFFDNNITSIPAGLLDNNLQAENFRWTFRDNNITSIPAGLFNNNPLANSFIQVFEGNTLDTPDLSRLYCELSVFNLNENVPFHGGSGNYDPALNFVVDGQTVNTGDARDVLVIDRGWTITDGGAV